MVKRKIIFRADGGPSIGMGHFIRTLALAEMLKDDFYCIYATQSPTDYQISEIKTVCHKKIDLPADEGHFNAFLELLKGDEIVVLDNYYFDTHYQERIKEKGCRLVCIDDMHDKHYVADVVINHAEGLDEKFFSKESHTQLCLGYNYCLLRSPFLGKTSKSINKDFDIFIAIGGTDPYNITAEIASTIINIGADYRVAVLSRKNNIKSILNMDYKNLHVFEDQTAEEIYSLMKRSRLGIFPASTISFEAIAARLPFLVGYFVENQMNIYNGIVKKNTGIPIGSFQTITSEEIERQIINFFNSETNSKKLIKTNQEELLDKASPVRICKIFKSL